MKFLVGDALVLEGRRLTYEVILFQFHELGSLLLKMTPLYTETASNRSGRLPLMRAPWVPKGGTCHNVPSRKYAPAPVTDHPMTVTFSEARSVADVCFVSTVAHFANGASRLVRRLTFR